MGDEKGLLDVHVEEREIDGVPAFFAEMPGPLIGGLIFRVGQADETLVQRGLTHLVEHLAFARLPDHRFSNGTVAMTRTSFEVKGDPGEVRDFINEIVGALADLPFDRLEVERRILRTEDQRRGGSLFSLAHYLRQGPANHGLIDCPELGLPGATAESVDAWRKQWFTRGNAVLWFSGEPPEGLDLSRLAEGDRKPPPEPQKLPFRFPAWYPVADGYVAVSMLGSRGMALWTAQAVLRERLYDRLRTGEGRSYEVTVDQEALTKETSSLFVLTDALPDETEHVRDAVSSELVKLSRTGPEPEEIEQLRSLMRRATSEPGFPAYRAERRATAMLMGDEDQSGDELDAELAELAPEDVSAALREALDTALWLVPQSVGMYDRRIHDLPIASDQAAEGRTYARPRGYPQDNAEDRLIVGPAGVSIVRGQTPATVEFERCRGLQVYSDGARALWGFDGIRLFVHPGDWNGAEQAIAAIDEAVDGSLVVDMGDDSGYEPPPLESGAWNPFRRRKR